MSVTLKDVGPWSPLIWSIIKSCGPTEAVVYAIVWSFAHQSKEKCTATLETIAKNSNVSVDTARRCLKVLVDNGYLQRIDGDFKRGLSNTYIVTNKAGIQTVAYDHPVGEEEPTDINYADYAM